MKIDQIIKRDFDIKAFDLDKITEAIHKAMVAVEVGTRQRCTRRVFVCLHSIIRSKK